MIDMFKDDQISRIWDLLNAGGMLKLTSELENYILSLLPPSPDPVTFPSIEQLGPGVHYPCPVNVLKGYPSGKAFIKNEDGNRVRIETTRPEHGS